MDNTKVRNYGLDLEREKREQDGTEWRFGGMSQLCMYAVPQAVREAYLPKGEVQFGREDFQDCATRSPINALAAKFTYAYEKGLIKPANRAWLDSNGYVVAGKVDFSDAFISILSGTTRTGNSLKAPLDAIHTYGLIPKAMLPAESWMTFDQYQDPKRITQAMRDLGAEFAKRFTINYEQVLEVHFGDALQDDFVGVAGFAWPAPVNGEYERTDGAFNHAFAMFKTPKFYIFDNYIDPGTTDDFIKKLAPDYDFLSYGYRVYVSAETTPEERSIQTSVFNALAANGLLSSFADWWRRFMNGVVFALTNKNDSVPPLSVPVDAPTMPQVAPLPPEPTPTPAPAPEAPKYLWDTKANIRHSMRVIGDELGLTVLQKDLLCDVCSCESGFNLKAKLVNTPKSIDRGLFQINNYYHPEATDALAYDPEWSTRWACKAILNRQAHALWSASEPCWNKAHKYDAII